MYPNGEEALENYKSTKTTFWHDAIQKNLGI
jgi:hypothetical protein